VTNLEKARIWKNVTSKINALGVAPRSVKEIKDKWRNLTSKAKSAFTGHLFRILFIKLHFNSRRQKGKVLCPTAFWVIT
jgi:hypothetical protein